jgi:hypothetical protein
MIIDESINVPGIKLKDLHAIDNMQLSDAFLGLNAHIKTQEESPVVIGYGLTGVIGGLEKEDLKRQISLGWDTKKAICFKEIDIQRKHPSWEQYGQKCESDMILGCFCKQLHSELSEIFPKNYQRWIMLERNAILFQCLVMEAMGACFGMKNQNKNGYDVYGIFSDPLFMQAIKDFIRNATGYYTSMAEKA